MLDEVDAPLDDANVDRFCRLLEAMATDTATRFLVITHHPMTMARMSRLFGVTMAEKGISQLVSVDLETAQRFREAVWAEPTAAASLGDRARHRRRHGDRVQMRLSAHSGDCDLCARRNSIVHKLQLFSPSAFTMRS